MNNNEINNANKYLAEQEDVDLGGTQEIDTSNEVIKIFYNDLDLATRTKIKETMIEKMGLDKDDEIINAKLDDRMAEVPLFIVDTDKLINSMDFDL